MQGFEVEVPALHAASGALTGDASAMHERGAQLAAALRSAGAAAGDGPLAAALDELAAAAGRQSGLLADSVAAAGAALAVTADRYSGDDRGVAARFGGPG